MSTEPDDLILRYLRSIDARLDRAIDDIASLKVRMGAIETAFAGHVARVNARFDQIEVRLDRIERRLGMIEAPRT